MAMSNHAHDIILEMKKLLGNVDRWLDKAVAHAATKKFDPAVLLQARLAPDMFPLLRQIQTSCDQAKFAAARCAGKDPPSHPDTEQTVDELKKRIATVVQYLDGFGATDFADLESRKISLPRWEGRSMTAAQFLIEYIMPNFFFHVTTTYAILRHNGVELGKTDYLAPLPLK